MAKTNAAFMSGVPELLILRLLSREEMYGYQLVRAIRIVSGEALDLAEGVVYPVLHSLEQRGLLKAKEKVFDGRNRIYYAVTAKGRKRLQELTNDWQRIQQGISNVLGEHHG
ncbi:MAG: helix-turn-helix transcriptional regulator [Pseudomonadota bacterium]